MATRPSTTAAAKACRTFIFLSLCSSFSSLLSFSHARSFTTLPRVPRSRLLVHCLSPHQGKRWSAKAAVRCGGGGGGGRRGSHRDSYLLLSLFPLFPFPPAAQKRPPLPSFSSESLFSSFATTSFSSPSRCTHPFARLQLRRPFSPSNSSLFLLQCSAPAYPPNRPSPRRQPEPPRSGFFLSVLLLRVLSSFLSLFLSAPRSRCPWSVISRRGGDENARLGLGARGGVFFFATSLPPLHPLLLSAFFSLSSFFSPLVLISRVVRASPPSWSVLIGKSIDCEQPRSHCRNT